MFFLAVMLILPLLAVSFPFITYALNWFIYFPLVTIAAGSVAWAILGVLSGFSIGGMESWVFCTLFVGLPFGLWSTKVSMS